jgi:hypothetical protein
VRGGVDHHQDIASVPERGQHHGSADYQAHDDGYDANQTPFDRF